MGTIISEIRLKLQQFSGMKIAGILFRSQCVNGHLWRAIRHSVEVSTCNRVSHVLPVCLYLDAKDPRPFVELGAASAVAIPGRRNCWLVGQKWDQQYGMDWCRKQQQQNE